MTAGTAAGYASGYKKRLEYLESLPLESYPGQYLDGLSGDHERAKRIVLFMAYLYMEKGLRDEQINKAVTCVAYQFGVEGISTSFFKLVIISRGHAAGGRRTGEARILEEKRLSNVILPVC